MVESLSKKAFRARTGVGVIDCDVHNNVPSIEALYPYLSDHWRDYLIERGVRSLEPN